MEDASHLQVRAVILAACVLPSVVDLSGGHSYPRLLASAWMKSRSAPRMWVVLSTSRIRRLPGRRNAERMRRSAILHLRIPQNSPGGFVARSLPDELGPLGREISHDMSGTVTGTLL